MDLIVLSLFLLALGIGSCVQSTIGHFEDEFLNRDVSNALRAASCIAILLVHIPERYSNALQSAIGGFAYIGVMMFFLLSGYGLSASMGKSGYLSHFWRNRLPALLIPQLLANVVAVVLGLSWRNGLAGCMKMLFTLNDFVVMLTGCYVIFYAFYRLAVPHRDVFVCLGTVALSVLAFFFADAIPFPLWPVPALGFALGICVFRMRDFCIRLARNRFWACAVLLACAVVVLGLLYRMYKNDGFVGDYLVRALLGATVVGLALMLSTRFSCRLSRLPALGAMSYEVYLLHGAVIGALSGLGVPKVVFIPAVVVSTLLLSALVHWPAKAFIKRIRA